jgi:hypothetical protein
MLVSQDDTEGVNFGEPFEDYVASHMFLLLRVSDYFNGTLCFFFLSSSSYYVPSAVMVTRKWMSPMRAEKRRIHTLAKFFTI